MAVPVLISQSFPPCNVVQIPDVLRMVPEHRAGTSIAKRHAAKKRTIYKEEAVRRGCEVRWRELDTSRQHPSNQTCIHVTLHHIVTTETVYVSAPTVPFDVTTDQNIRHGAFHSHGDG